MQAVSKGLEKVEQELAASESDGEISSNFQKVRKHTFILMIFKYESVCTSMSHGVKQQLVFRLSR